MSPHTVIDGHKFRPQNCSVWQAVLDLQQDFPFLEMSATADIELNLQTM